MTVSFRYLAIVVALCYCFVHESSCQTSLSSHDQQELLDAHNHYRGIVTPTASDMQTMVTVSVAESNLLKEWRSFKSSYIWTTELAYIKQALLYK